MTAQIETSDSFARLLAGEDAFEAFPVMTQTESGHVNQQAAFTALKPLEERAAIAKHPSQVLDPNLPDNFYRYGWVAPSDTVSATNYAVFGSFAAVIAASIYLVAGTKLVKFIQFFLTKRHYAHLTISVEQPENDESASGLIYQTPRYKESELQAAESA